MHKDTARLAAALFGKAVRISPDGEAEVVDFADYPSTLKALQEGVEGLVDVVRCDGVDAWVNDEGIYTHADQPNHVGTLLATALGATYPGAALRGPMVFAESDEEGETVPLGAEQSVRVADLLLRLADSR